MRVLSLCLLCSLAAAPAAAKLRVIATVPDLVDIAQRVGGEHVSVEGLARGTEDIHQIVVRPSHVVKLNRADAVIFLGLTIEHSFLPALLDAAANLKARPAPEGCEGPACIDCSRGVQVLDKPQTLSRAEGELHALGNPHYNTSPENGPIIARNVADGLSRIDPAHAQDYQKNLKDYEAELAAKLAELRRLAGPLKGVKAVSYHKDVAYIGRFTGIDFVDAVELKPGVGPTPAHLEALVKKMKAEGVTVIAREQQYDAKTCDWLARQTGAKVAVIATMAGALPGADTFLKFSERNVRALLQAAGKGGS